METPLSSPPVSTFLSACADDEGAASAESSFLLSQAVVVTMMAAITAAAAASERLRMDGMERCPPVAVHVRICHAPAHRGFPNMHARGRPVIATRPSTHNNYRADTVP